MSKAIRWTATLSMVIFYVVACSPVKFSAGDNPDQGITANCNQSPEGCLHDYVVDVMGPKVDILFVNDNSASMSFEQKALAARFNGFIQFLDSKHVDYRIAMTTTDIQDSNNGARPINGHGTLQNGNIISFGNGISYLTPSVPDRVGRFANTIVRPETRQCEEFIASYIATYGLQGVNTTDYETKYNENCPSGDERGIYAANLNVKNNPGGWMRSDAYLAIIFLSDEDVRSGLYCNGPQNPGCTNYGFPLTDMDQPMSLFNTLKSVGKEYVTEVHSITVKDSACLTEQRNQVLSVGNTPVPATNGLVSGSYGSVYQTFAAQAWGESISICMGNYAAALQPIADKIASQKGYVLQCDNPLNLQIQTVPADPGFSFSREGRSVTYNKALPPGTKVHFKYTCPFVF